LTALIDTLHKYTVYTLQRIFYSSSCEQ